jgi:hypothetical protein
MKTLKSMVYGLKNYFETYIYRTFITLHNRSYQIYYSRQKLKCIGEALMGLK